MNGNALNAAAALLAVTAGFAYLNHYVLRLPRHTGLLAIAVAASILLRLLDAAFPALGLGPAVAHMLARIDFSGLLLNGALGFLLFAAALDVDVKALWERKGTIFALATAGVLLSTFLFGVAMWAVFRVVGLPVSFAYCLLFGALISPTDPVTVLAVLGGLGIPSRLQAVIAGESLFNDGIGIVLYTLFLDQAVDGGAVSPLDFVLRFLRDAGGGALLGLATGGVAFLATRGIDEYNTELIISLALVTGTYGLAQTFGVSGPVAVVIAGLMMGSIGVRYAVSGTTHDYLSKFWSLTDEVLNALLFLLIGLQVAAIPLQSSSLLAAGLAIPLALVIRAVSVAIPGMPLNLSAPHKLRAVALLTWSGLRGGISVALALSLPQSGAREPLISACYAVVIFTMLVQGLTLGRFAERLYPEHGR